MAHRWRLRAASSAATARGTTSNATSYVPTGWTARAGRARRWPGLVAASRERRPGERRGAAERLDPAIGGQPGLEVHMRSTVLRFGSALAILALVVSACGGQGGGSEAPSSAAASAAASTEPEPSDEVAGEPVEINWFCCLGAGDDPAQVPTEEAVVEAFNESHDDIELVLEIVDYDSAFDVMSTEIAGGNAPDIVGPVGVSGAEAFHGQWLDLTDLIESTDYDLEQFTEGSVEFYNVGGEGQIGLPFAIFPSMLYYHRD